jgi:hypothetical protein
MGGSKTRILMDLIPKYRIPNGFIRAIGSID